MGCFFLPSCLDGPCQRERKKVDPKRFAGNPSRFASLRPFLSLHLYLVGDLIIVQGSQSCRSKRIISRKEGIGPRKKTKRAHACFFSLDAPPCFFFADSSLSPFYLRIEQKTHNVRQQGPEKAHENDLDDGEEGLEESRSEGEREAFGEYSLFVSHLGKKQLGQRSSYQLVSLASFHAVASC